jgi:hypothetical protein
MKCRIVRVSKGRIPTYLSTEIDSGGMEVYWTSAKDGQVFDSEADAAAFMQRVLERFPREQLKVVQFIEKEDSK